MNPERAVQRTNNNISPSLAFSSIRPSKEPSKPAGETKESGRRISLSNWWKLSIAIASASIIVFVTYGNQSFSIGKGDPFFHRSLLLAFVLPLRLRSSLPSLHPPSVPNDGHSRAKLKLIGTDRHSAGRRIEIDRYGGVNQSKMDGGVNRWT